MRSQPADRVDCRNILRLGPAHHPEATYVVNVHNVHLVKAKIVKVHPVSAVGITCQVEFPCFIATRPTPSR